MGGTEEEAVQPKGLGLLCIGVEEEAEKKTPCILPPLVPWLF